MEENIFEENKRLDFKSLTPRSDVDLSVYNDAFLFALSNKNIKNVAITGSYGAGKSSVLETFKNTEKGKEYKYLHVSLAHFEENSDDTKDELLEDKNFNLERLLEGKIINQLIHKIPTENIIDSKVAIRRKVDEDNVILWSIGIVTGLLLAVYLFSYLSLSEVETKNDFVRNLCNILLKPELLWCAAFIEVCLIFFLIKYLVTAQMKNKFFKKICIKNSEIELFGEEKDADISYFDKYLDEIKYLLVNSGIDVFVFEDIDRYKINMIFEKLREINNIINENRDEPIRFFYLVRDDLFEEKDRAKFFDFIIPIIPVVSGHNSFNIFFKYMGKNGGELSRQFLKQISLYIDDMRILNNIYNEYQIYRENFKEISVEKSAEKIFSLITYKNLFPQDFIKLQNGDGYVASLFEELKEVKKRKAKELEAEIEGLKEDINGSKKIIEMELLQDVKEVDALFINLDEEYSCDGKQKRDYDDYAEYISDILENPHLVKYKSGTSWLGGENKIKNLVDKMKENKEYIKRKEQVQQKEENINNNIKNAYEKIEKLEGEIANLDKLSYAEYAKNYSDIKLIFSEKKEVESGNEKIGEKEKYNKKISKSPYIKLIHLLLEDGYIDENYSDFMVVFHNSDIEKNDKRYVRAVLENQCLDYFYPILNPATVDEYLKEQNLEREAAINYDMFYYYMKSGHEEKKNKIMSTITRVVPYDFLVYLLKNSELAYIRWMPYLYDIWEPMYAYIKENEPELLGKFCALMLLVSLGERELHIESEIVDYIKNEACKNAHIFEMIMKHDSKDITRPRERWIKILVDNLKMLDCKLPYFEFDMKESEDFAQAIYRNDLYEINVEMIKQILKKFYNMKLGENETDLFDKVVSTNSLDNADNSPLYTYIIADNINEYIAAIENANMEFADSEENLFVLLRGADVEHQKIFLSRMKTCFHDVDALGNIDSVNRVIRHKRLAFEPENIFKYYNLYMDAKKEVEDLELEFASEDLLVRYINDFPDEAFHFSEKDLRLYDEKTDDEQAEIFRKVCESESMEDSKYRVIAKALHRIWKNGAPSQIPFDKVGILIEEKIIRMTKAVLPGMRERYPDYIKQFILTNIDKYTNEVIDDTNFSLSECEMLLEEDVSDEYKMKLLSYAKDGISVNNRNISEDLILYILENNYDENDFSYIINKDFDKRELQDMANSMAKTRADEIVDEYFDISKSVCKYLLGKENEEISLAKKKRLFASHMSYFSKDEIVEIMEELEMKEFLPIFDKKNPLIEDTTTNILLLTSMKKCGWVSSFKEEEKKKGFYRVYSKR